MKFIAAVVCLGIGIAMPPSAFGQAPALVNYQGRLVNGTNLVNGTVGLSLRLFAAPSGGTALYEDSNTVTVADGLYATFIGDNTTSGTLTNALTGTDVWIEVAVNGTALSPRERMVSAPYALNVSAAGIAGTIADANLSANVARLNGATQTFTGVVNFTNRASAFSGSFSGNGLAVTNLNVDALVLNTGTGDALTNVASVVAWGAGTNDLNDSYREGQCIIPAAATGVMALAAGRTHSLALLANGTVLAWGSGTTDSGTSENYGQSIVPAAATGIQAIAAGTWHSLAARSNGTVLAWGAGDVDLASGNERGQCIVPPTATGVVDVAGGRHFSLALRADGTIVGWGAGTNYTGLQPHYGQCMIPASATGVVAISCGYYHALALRSDGAVVGWGATNGSDNAGQAIVPASATGIVAISAGGFHSLALRADGTVIAWGSNSNGQTNVPATATGVVAIAAGGYHSLALRSDGVVVAWGMNTYGQTDVPPEAFGPEAIAAGSYHSLALNDAVVFPPAWSQAEVALLNTPTNVFMGQVSAAQFIGDGSGLTNLSIGDLPAGSLSNVHYAAGSITGDKIADGTISNASLSASVQTNISARLASNVWAAADSTTNYVRRTGDAMSGDLAIGATNISGRLDVYRTASNTPAISLIGAASQISTYGSDGQEQIRLWGGAYGEILLYDSSPANGQPVRLSANGTSGGELDLRDRQNSNRISLSAGLTNTAATLLMFDSEGGLSRVSLSTGLTNGAAILSLRNTTNSASVSIRSDGDSYILNPLGIGISSPEAELHISRGSAGAVTAHSSSVGVLEGSSDTYLSLLAPTTGATAVVFGSPLNASDGGIFYNSIDTRDLRLLTAGGNTRMTITSNGNVGVGTTAPEAKFHVASGASGADPAVLGALAVFESGSNTFLTVKSPTNCEQGLVFATSVTNHDASVLFNFNGERSLRFRTAGSITRMIITTNGNVGIGTVTPTNRLHVAGTVQATAYITGSDRSMKENVKPVSVEDVLAKVSALPISTWNFKDDNSGLHLGPMAQDFRAAFGLGNTDSGIFTVDESGVALAAIQALKKENDELKQSLDELRARLEALEKQ